MRPQAWEWGQEPKALDTKLWLSFLSWQTPAATGSAPPPVHKVFRKWGPRPPTADSIHRWSPVTHPIFTNHHSMGKSGHTGKTQKAAESIADNPMSITHGMELLENPTVGLADPRTGHRRDGERRPRSGWWPTAPRGGPRRSAEKAPAARTPLWRGGRSTRRDESFLRSGDASARPPAEETAPPAIAGGPSRDSWIRNGPRSAGEGARRSGGPSPPTAGGRGPPSAGASGPWRRGPRRTESATEKGKSPAWNRMPAEAPGTPPSREGDLTKNVAPTSASETPRHIPTCTVSKVLRGRSQTWNNLVSYLVTRLTPDDPMNSNKHFMHLKSYKKKNIYEKYCAWCIILKKVFLNAYFFGNYLPNAAPKGYTFCFYINCRIVKNCSLLGGNLFLSWLNRAVDHFL